MVNRHDEAIALMATAICMPILFAPIAHAFGFPGLIVAFALQLWACVGLWKGGRLFWWETHA